MRYDMFARIRKQNGFTLIEIVLALALTGILGLGIAAFTVQTFTGTKRSSAHTEIILQLENTGYWVSRDVQMSQNVTTGTDAGFPLQLNWIDENDDMFQVTFSLTDDQIMRSLVKNDETPLSTLIAQAIDPAPELTNCSYTDGLLTLNLTARLGSWSTNRTYLVKIRPE
jgi:prepilin-type N-terminal cleavage/methylation domain-containing protein